MPANSNRPHVLPAAVETADGEYMIALSLGTADSARPLSEEIDEDFVSRHLTCCPKAVLSKIKKLSEIDKSLRKTQKKCAGKEQLMCKPLIAVLNRISQEVFRSFSKAKSARLGLDGGPIVDLLWHGGRSLARFPTSRRWLPLENKPEILGVFGDEQGFLTLSDGRRRGLPYHRVETIIEIKPQPGAGAIEQALACLFRLQQARADRSSCYALL